jgi:LPXTG-site transpeptidase (sortase) family protein
MRCRPEDVAVTRRRLLVGASALVAVALVGALTYMHLAVPQKTLASTAAVSTTHPTTQPKATTPSASASLAATAPLTAASLAAPGLRNATTVAAPGGAIATISIPRIGIHGVPIYDRGLDQKHMMLIAPGYAVTHYTFSATIGIGNAVLYGHDDIQGNVFGHLYDLAPGDTIEVSTRGATQVYRVTGHQIVSPTTVSVLGYTGDVRLTVITCWPFNVDSKRWIVTAVPA